MDEIPDDTAFFKEEDKASAAYQSCVIGSTLAGMATGAFIGSGPGALAGGVVAYLYGSQACKSRYIQQGIRDKFSSTETLTTDEFTHVLQGVRNELPHLDRTAALDVVAAGRIGFPVTKA